MCENVDGVAGHLIYDGQPVDVVVDERADRLEQARVRVDTHERPLLVLQHLCNRKSALS